MHAMSVGHTFHMYRVSGCPGRGIIRCRPGSDTPRCGSCRSARLFENALESHEKNPQTSLGLAKDEHKGGCALVRSLPVAE
jgi:hypothetical protein